MYPVTTARFRKLRTCPTADNLILYGASELARERRAAIERHLSACDFCGAEMQLLSRHRPQGFVAGVTISEMPSHLRRLAEDMLAEPAFDRTRFVEMICELDRLTLTDAA